jgi:hypothetical protein
MLKFMFSNKIDEKEAENLCNRKYIEFPDTEFMRLSRKHDLNNDQYFIKFLHDIDGCDIPMKNVARDLITGNTHSFDKVSTGVRVLWLMAVYPDKFLYPTQWLGENCYQAMFDLGKERDIYIYEDSDMFSQKLADKIEGELYDCHTDKVVSVSNDKGFDYVIDMGY